MGISKLLICLAILVVSLGRPAVAAEFWPFGWWPGHWSWTSHEKFNSYLEDGKQTQNQQWANEDWYVQDWTSQYPDQYTLIDGFFKSDILREQTEESDVPVLIVGPNFYRLGGLDKRRVVTTLDSVYAITERNEYAMIILKDWHTKKEIGVFTKDGLQLE